MSKQANKSWPGIEVAIAGTTLAPEQIPARKMIQLLQGTLSAYELIAQERALKASDLRLVAIRKGSAAYDLRCPDEKSIPVTRELQKAFEGQGTLPDNLRKCIDRIHESARDFGRVRLTRYGRGGVAEPPIFLEVGKSEEPVPQFTQNTFLEGEVIGVDASKTGRVKLRLINGDTPSFKVGEQLARKAARLFLKKVRASATQIIDGDELKPGELLSIEGLSGSDGFLAEMDALRDELKADGVSLNASDWLERED